MEKPDSLRRALMAALPEFRNEPDRIDIWIEDGAVKARQTDTHGFAFSYPLSILLEKTSTDIAIVAHAINRWLRVNQPDLMAGGNRDTFKFETDILDNKTADILITIDICENVTVEKNEDGSWAITYLAEPDPLFTNGDPVAPNTDTPPLQSVESIVQNDAPLPTPSPTPSPTPAPPDPDADLLALLSSTGGQSSSHDYRGATNAGEWVSLDRTANQNNHFSTAGSSKQPALVPGGASFDSNDQTEQPINGGTFSLYFGFTPGDLGTSGTLVSNQSSAVLSIYQSGAYSSPLPVPTSVINGASIVVCENRGDLFDALAAATGEVILRVQGLTMTGSTQLRFGRGSSSGVGVKRRVIVLDHEALAADLETAQALAIEVAALP